MQLVVGKSYVMSNGCIARCICTDRLYKGRPAVVLLYVGYDGDEFTFSCQLDGSSLGGRLCIVKEYIPPVKVRLVVFMTSAGILSTTSTAEPEKISDPEWPRMIKQVNAKRLSDTIIEVTPE